MPRALRPLALVLLGLGGCSDDASPGDAAPADDLSMGPVVDMASGPDLRISRDLLPPPPDLVPPRLSFADPSTFQVGAQPLHVLLVDLDGDGRLDLVTANYGDPNGMPKRPSNIGVFGGQGNASPLFKSRGALAAATGANYVAAADFNGDGRLDLAASSFDTDTLGVYLAQPGGGYAAAVSTSLLDKLPEAGPSSLAAADFDGDGKADVALTLNTENAVVTLRGRGDGTFDSRTTYNVRGTVDPFSVVAADMDGDTHLDLVVASAASGTVHILGGRGDGTFDSTGSPFDVGASAAQAITADFNHDGKLDVAAANFSEHSASVLLGNGDRTLQKELRLQAGLGSGSLCAADLDLDGKQDLVVANHDVGTLSTYLGRGDGTFEAGPQLSLGNGRPFFLACGDLDGDKRPDLIACDDTGFIAWILRGQAP